MGYITFSKPALHGFGGPWVPLTCFYLPIFYLLLGFTLHIWTTILRSYCIGCVNHMNALTPSKCSPTNLKIYFACIGTGSWKEISACLKFPSLLLPIALDLGSQCAALRPNGSFLTELNRIFLHASVDCQRLDSPQ